MRVLIASSIDPDAINKLHEKHDVKCVFNTKNSMLREYIKDREVLIFRSGVNITAEVMTSAAELKLLIRAGCGLDNIDINHVRTRGLHLVTIPQPAAYAVAELTFAHMLTLARKILDADSSMRQGLWKKHEIVGSLLTGKTLGIVGVGNIGMRVGQLGVAWGMKVIGYDVLSSPERIKYLLEHGIQLTDFGTVISEADFLCLHTSLDESTYHLINSDVLRRMKPGAFLINMARGGVVDDKALYHELTQVKRLGGAALDVHENEGAGKISPFVKLPNVVLSPHIGSMTIDTQRDVGRRIIEIIESFSEKHFGEQTKHNMVACN